MTSTRRFNLADLFEVVAEAVPDRTALVAGDARLTYRQLDERANQVGHHLRHLGVRPGDHVGILSWNRTEWLETMLGAFKARAVPINLNYRYVEDELRYVVDNADLRAIVHEPEFADLVEKVAPALPTVTIGVEYEQALKTQSPQGDFGPRQADDHYVLYTGGTTGMPKGVVWRSDDIFFAAMGGGNFGGDPVTTPEELGPAAAGRDPLVWLVTAPLMHGGGQWVTFIGLTTGGTVVLSTDHTFDPERTWDLVARERVQTLMVIGDAMARPLAETLAAAPDGRFDPSSLFVIGSGGAIFSAAVKDQLRSQLPNLIINDGFGSSETGTVGRGVAHGFTVNDHTAVLDDDLRPLAPGDGGTGVVARRGHIPLGYYKDDEKTAATFKTDAGGTRWVLSGDMATVEPDGTITVFGRGSQCITTGGEKVFPEEVEAALKGHPDVFDAVVIGASDERFGQQVCAVVAPRTGTKPELDDLVAHCRKHIAGYKVPRKLVLVDEVQRTPVGKADYKWAKDLIS